MVAALTASAPARVDAPPVPKAPGSLPVRIPAPRRPLDDAQWPLRHHPEAAGEARRAARSALDGWGVDGDTCDAVVLMVCELVTNAVEHAKAPLALHLHRDVDHGVWVGVSDGGPAKREGDRIMSRAPDEHGRGLAIVEALATGHGHSTRADGSTHWARLGA